MARKLTPTEFFENLAERNNMSKDKVKDFWVDFVDYAVNELVDYNVIDLPYFGKLKAIKKGGRYAHVPNLDEGAEEKTKRIYVEPYLQLSFSTTDSFKDQLNGRRITRKEFAELRDRERRAKLLEVEEKRQAEIARQKEEQLKAIREKKLAKIKERRSKGK